MGIGQHQLQVKNLFPGLAAAVLKQDLLQRVCKLRLPGNRRLAGLLHNFMPGGQNGPGLLPESLI